MGRSRRFRFAELRIRRRTCMMGVCLLSKTRWNSSIWCWNFSWHNPRRRIWWLFCGCYSEGQAPCSKAPPSAVNQGMLEPAKWKYGPAFDPPPNSKIWNPVMIKMMMGEKVTGGTVFSSDSPETYCAMANAGYDFIWTEMQHDSRDWEAVGRMWKACPHAKAVPGVRVAYTDEREIQHAMDL